MPIFDRRPIVDPKWLVEAKRLAGTKEDLSKKSNPKIIAWAKALGGWIASWYKDDAVPWCGLGVAHCLQVAGEPMPQNPLGALNYVDTEWGQRKLGLLPCYGAIATFKRSGGGHVGFYLGEDATSIMVYGFNQQDTVGVTWIAKDRLHGYVWPPKTPLPATGRVMRKRDGTLSTNEA